MELNFIGLVFRRDIHVLKLEAADSNMPCLSLWECSLGQLFSKPVYENEVMNFAVKITYLMFVSKKITSSKRVTENHNQALGFKSEFFYFQQQRNFLYWKYTAYNLTCVTSIPQKSSLKHHPLKTKQEQTTKNSIKYQTDITKVNKIKFKSKFDNFLKKNIATDLLHV